MAVPKKRASKSRTRRRRTINSAFKMPEFVRSSESGEIVIRHRIDTKNGVYRGKRVLDKI